MICISPTSLPHSLSLVGCLNKAKEPSLATLSGVMVSKLDEQTFTSEFDFHQVLHSYSLVPHLSEKLSKL